MENILLAKHPDLEDILAHNNIKTYKKLSETGRIIEQFEKKENGEWTDTTELAKLEEAIAAENKEIARRQRAIDKAKEAECK